MGRSVGGCGGCGVSDSGFSRPSGPPGPSARLGLGFRTKVVAEKAARKPLRPSGPIPDSAVWSWAGPLWDAYGLRAPSGGRSSQQAMLCPDMAGEERSTHRETQGEHPQGRNPQEHPRGAPPQGAPTGSCGQGPREAALVAGRQQRSRLGGTSRSPGGRGEWEPGSDRPVDTSGGRWVRPRGPRSETQAGCRFEADSKAHP